MVASADSHVSSFRRDSTHSASPVTRGRKSGIGWRPPDFPWQPDHPSHSNPAWPTTHNSHLAPRTFRPSHPTSNVPYLLRYRSIMRNSLLLAAASPAVAQRAIPTPSSILGFEPGADRHLPSWKQIVDYFTALDKASPRVSVRTLGQTTLGRPFIVAFISDSSTLANLDHYRQIQRRLMDPRLRAANERQKLIDEGKNVILVTSAIHSNESGGFTTPIVLADRLARGNDRDTKMILDNTIIMLVPSQNPDGVDIVGDYYR